MIAEATHALWNSTLLLHDRFGTTDKQEPEAQLRCVAEEHFEFQHAAEEAYSAKEMGLTSGPILHDLTAEAADLIVTVMGVLQHNGVELDQLEQAMRLVASKNDQKTLKTHFVDRRGKISRKE